MADVMFNIGRGILREKIINGSDLIIILLKVAQADDTLRDHDTLAAVLAAANTEADFTNYTRKVIANAGVSIAIDDTNNWADVDFADPTYTAAGGATNNTLVKALVCIDGANDTARIPVCAHDFAVTTDGSDLVLQLPSGGLYRSA